MLRKFLAAAIALAALQSAYAADSTGNQGQPSVSPAQGAVGNTCPGFGATAFDSNGSILSCQSGVWAQPLTFTVFTTTVSQVNPNCTGSGANADPNPPNYNDMTYRVTCGARYCTGAVNYSYGIITETGSGWNADKPYNSAGNTQVVVNCSK